jgi:hypothetical protein
MTATYTVYHLETGLLGAVLMLPDDDAQRAVNTPAGHGLIEGAFDARCQRLDVATGEVVPYRPPAPADDADSTWQWSETGLRWVAVATPARQAREERQRRIAAARELEASQGRALRALLLNPADVEARAKLEEIEAAIVSLGIRD